MDVHLFNVFRSEIIVNSLISTELGKEYKFKRVANSELG